MAVIHRNKRLEKMPKKQHTGLYALLMTVKKYYVKYTISLGAHVFHLGRHFLFKVGKAFKAIGLRFAEKSRMVCKKLSGSVLQLTKKHNIPFRKTVVYFKGLYKNVKSKKTNDGLLSASAYCIKDIGRHLWGNKSKVVTLVNYGAPVVSLIFLISLVNYASATHYGIGVECDGQFIGYIEKENVYDEAQKLMQDRITYVDGDSEIKMSARFSVERIAEDQEVYTAAELTDKMISSSDTPVIDAYGLYINDNFIGAVTDKTKIENTLKKLLDTYRSGAEDETVSFVDDVELRKGLYLENGITSEDAIINFITSEKTVEKHYTVVAGDSPSLIAQNCGVSYSELKALNPGIEESCFIGDDVILNRAEPYLSVRVTKTEEYDITLDYDTVTTEDSTKYKGTTVLVQEGVEGSAHVTADVSYINGYEESRTITSQVTTKEPVTRKITVGTKANGYSDAAWAASGGGFLWPVGGNGGYISSGYGWRWGSFHAAIDIAASYGTSIYAAADGYVSSVQYLNYGYGYNVIITHSNGYQTLYAHCSSILVTTGQKVSKGDLIARIGSTGNSTGNHCHFEIRENGVKLNPAYYVHQ